MKLSILIATQGRRNAKFRTLLQRLMQQVRKYEGEIEVVAYWNNGEEPIGVIRRELVKESKGEYVCFVDDDDAVPDYYCEEIINALGKDYVGFKVKLFVDGIEMPPAYHDLQYKIWYEDNDGYYRGVTHLNPIKRSLAVLGDFDAMGAGEDARWADSIMPYVKTQNYIDKVMYFYYHDKEDTSFASDSHPTNRAYKRPEVDYKYFRYHPDSKLEKEATNG